MKYPLDKKLRRVALLSILGLASASTLGDIILHPGYLEGTFTIGDYNVSSANISASGDGYSASKSVSGDSYSLTVEGGEWDYTVGANILVRPVDAYYPYTRLYFSDRTIQVPVGNTVINDYSFGVGTPNAAATIQFEVNITGDAYNSWTAYGYARKVTSTGALVKPYSQSYAHSSYSTTGTWDMPVVPNDNVRIYATVSIYNVIDGRGYNTNYNFWTSTPYLYESIEAGEILPIQLTINHVAPTPYDPPDPPQYEYGAAEGMVELAALPNPDDFTRSRVNCRYPYDYSEYITANPGNYLIDYMRTGLKTCQVYSWFDWLIDGQNYSQSLTWPYTEGDPINNRVEILANQTAEKNFYNEAGKIEGQLTFSGTLENQALNYSLSIYGASDFYEFIDGAWVRERQPTYGGYTAQSKSTTDSDPNYHAYLTKGPWLPYRVSSSFSDSSQGYYRSFSLNIYDYSYYYNGSSYDFGAPTYIEAGSTTVQDRDYCTGSVVVRFRDESGGLLSYPRLNASGNRYNDSGQRELYATMSGNSNVRNALEPIIELHGPTADYTLSNIRFQTEDGTYLTFPGFPITLECGVRKGVPISGKPKILVEQPPAYHLTNAPTTIVSGTAADDNGISTMTVNEDPIVFAPTGNPDNEVSFSYTLTLIDGTNTIVTTATDVDGNESFDERPIYVDHWLPTVTIVTPADGQVFLDPQASVPLTVEAVDQGYGFTVNVYLDDELIREATGPANEISVETLTVNHVIAPLTLGAHVIRADVTDAAGNSASTSVTITTNTDPVATDDTYEGSEDTPLNIAAPGVLTNDSDADGDSLTVHDSTPPANGSLLINPDGSFSYVPSENHNGEYTFSYTVSDGNGGADTATVTLNILAVNDPPVAGDDVYTTNEDESLHIAASGVLANDSDIEDDVLTAVLVSGPGNGTLVLNADGSFDYTPAEDFYGTDGFTYQANDGELASETATVNITVNPVNDPPVVDIDVTSQSVQYSDRIAPVTVTAYDIDSPQLNVTSVGTLPLGLSMNSDNGCIASGAGSSCSWTLEGQTLVGAGSYAITLAVSDGEYVPSPQVDTALTVTSEDATVELYTAGNPASVEVAQDGGASDPFSLTVHVSETLPDLPAESAAYGDIAKATVSMSLVPLGLGSIDHNPSSCASVTNGTGYDALQEVTCDFNLVDVEIYTVTVAIAGDFYQGTTEGILIVYDPSLGFITGGGWFYWPDTNDKTNFGYNVKYGKNGKNVKGNLLVIRHLADGDKYRIKSNVISNLAVGVDPSGSYGWAWFDGKSTYQEPGMPEAEGNHRFTVYLEDHDEPGSGIDRFWLMVKDKDGILIDAISMSEPEPDYATAIEGGNIVAPH